MTERWPFLNKAKPFIQENWKASGFQDPTNVQKNAVDLILDGRDVIAESPTGTGKTLAYVLPILEKLEADQKNVQAVILAPSRELVMQIFDVIVEWKKGSDIRAASLIGGANIKKQQEKLKKHPHIIAGTPGRVFELIKMKKLKMHEVKTIVLDETDHLLTPEHRGTIQSIIKSTLRDRQLLCFSATLKDDAERELREMTKDAEVLKIKRSKEESAKVKHQFLVCDQRDKVKILQKFSRLPGMQALVFVKDIGNLNVYAEKLKFHHVEIGVLHSEAKKIERAKILQAFEAGEFTLLLATDIAARGIDIEDLPYVIHADLPNVEGYIHRSGRTGRAGNEGTVISLVNRIEEERLKKLAKKLEIPLQRIVYERGRIIER
ncbi:DEAD/DEAH box helicase [Bacillus licheniformis]|jgi:superfamily II DNA/RNA helicase|uniref:ATP binding helicase n=7 Tax=Bacillales TaxID=1385 RepID=Q65MK3_BACLD|nr:MULTISPECIES: DEAD/DEAH box helicase [Bacillus]MBJ7888844.1 DEAD/DEAH box helicase [Bacillaceae bacterium HSR45]MBY8349327.1 DEAD/DEAH box helicase [Bacillus sp. PCH94]MDP4081896.1 DEAD/DEAH box helicase [Bacillota bacterium]AAU22362.1 putative ATP binding helicase [Bacillus licheniformis DSM 13 = ATCC 14580]AAU39711.1 DEAD-box RNA helicase YfmL [Bacillus licheniformis DSM 13 = ATCC 14580]